MIIKALNEAGFAVFALVCVHIPMLTSSAPSAFYFFWLWQLYLFILTVFIADYWLLPFVRFNPGQRSKVTLSVLSMVVLFRAWLPFDAFLLPVLVNFIVWISRTRLTNALLLVEIVIYWTRLAKRVFFVSCSSGALFAGARGIPGTFDLNILNLRRKVLHHFRYFKIDISCIPPFDLVEASRHDRAYSLPQPSEISILHYFLVLAIDEELEHTVLYLFWQSFGIRPIMKFYFARIYEMLLEL